MTSFSIAVLGAGSFGMALALAAHRKGNRVSLWGHHPQRTAELAATRRNPRYLPGCELPAGLLVTSDLAEALAGRELILLVVPSHAFRQTLQHVSPLVSPHQPIAWATKGLDPEGGGLLHQAVAEIFSPGTPAAVLSGPTFAREVAAGLPTAMTVAANSPTLARSLADLFHDTAFRIYTSSDLIGVQLGGALKNVLAIAAGVSDGLGFGANGRAALITRGLAEMMRLGLALGGQRETLMGLSGVGDLVLTCTDDQSRNRRLGLGLGQGRSMQEILASIGQEVEGIAAARDVRRLAQRHYIELPIAEQVYQVLHAGLPPLEAVRNLLTREPKPEL